MSNRKLKKTDEESSPSSGLALVSKAFTAEYPWADKDDFLDVIYWMRQIMGVIMGLIWGLIAMKGFFGLALFFVVNVVIIYVYYNNFQKIDEEEYGGVTEILKEGLMTSFSSFLVAWIILYSALHSETHSMASSS